MTEGELQMLNTYDRERKRGLVHAEYWQTKMADLRAQLNAMRDVYRCMSCGHQAPGIEWLGEACPRCGRFGSRTCVTVGPLPQENSA